MAEARVVLVVGASGAAATRIVERASHTAGFEAVGLSRRTPPGGAGDWIAADLLDAAGLARALSARPDITHVVYASRAPHGESGARAAGFTGAVDTWAMFAEQIAGYRAAKVLPPA